MDLLLLLLLLLLLKKLNDFRLLSIDLILEGVDVGKKLEEHFGHFDKLTSPVLRLIIISFVYFVVVVVDVAVFDLGCLSSFAMMMIMMIMMTTC